MTLGHLDGSNEVQETDMTDRRFTKKINWTLSYGFLLVCNTCVLRMKSVRRGSSFTQIFFMVDLGFEFMKVGKYYVLSDTIMPKFY